MPSASRAPGGPKRRPASSPARASLTGPARAADASRFAPVAGRIGAFALLAQLVEHLHGKEGVDGSSPSEGFTERPAKRLLELSQWETTVTRGHSRHYLVFPRQAYRQVVFGLIKLIRTDLTPSVPRGDSPNRRGRSK